MPDQKTRADALREFLTGAGSDGATQTNPNLSLGNYRSATEIASLGIAITNPITGISVLFAGGANPVGDGILQAVDSNNLVWTPNGQTQAGPPVSFVGTQTKMVESAINPGQFLRITGVAPFTPGSSTITLSYLPNNYFGMDDVLVANASAGISEYRASMVRNESSNIVYSFQRWIGLLGTPQTSSISQLGSSGSGILATSASLLDWPEEGWCQVRSSGGTLKEVVYYTSRNNVQLFVPVTGRALLGTTATAGSSTDVLSPVPGIALAIDTAGVQAFGTNIQTIANSTTPPSSVTWNLEITEASGLQIGNVGVGDQVGIWMWRQIPAGAMATPAALNKVLDSYAAM